MSEPGTGDSGGWKQALSNIVRGGGSKEKKELDAIRKDLFVVRQAVDTWANRSLSEHFPGEKGRPYLPDRPYIPIDGVQGLITEKSERAEELFAASTDSPPPTIDEQGDCWNYFFYAHDTGGVPEEWLNMNENSYIIFLVPHYEQVFRQSDFKEAELDEKRGGNTGYGITIVTRKGNKIYRLISGPEEDFREGRRKYVPGDTIDDPLPLPRLLATGPNIYDIEVTDVTEFPKADNKAIVWMGTQLRGYELDSNESYLPESPARHRQMSINGSIAYLAHRGSPSPAKRDVRMSVQAPDPVLGGLVPLPIPNPVS